MSGHQRQDDAYVRPRYPVDEPPTYRASCLCGWTGPQRYRGLTDHDWNEHAEQQAAVSGQDGLRSAIAEAVWGCMADRPWLSAEDIARAVLALPEVAALRAKADAADRVLTVLDELEDRKTDLRDLDAVDRLLVGAQRAAVYQIRRALGGPAPC